MRTCYTLHCFVCNIKNAFTILFTQYIPWAHNAIRIVMLSDLSYIWHKVGPLMMQVALISSTHCKKVKMICVLYQPKPVESINSLPGAKDTVHGYILHLLQFLPHTVDK